MCALYSSSQLCTTYVFSVTYNPSEVYWSLWSQRNQGIITFANHCIVHCVMIYMYICEFYYFFHKSLMSKNNSDDNF